MRILALAALSSFTLSSIATAQQPAPGAETRPRAEAPHEGGDHARARRLLAILDVDGDGVISGHELHWAREVLARAERAPREEGGDKHDGKVGEKPGDTLRERLDKNDDGKVGPREREMARRAHDRADKNDDGKVGPREREMARRAHDRADKNDDGKVGPREREMARRAHDRADKNDDGKVGPREREQGKPAKPPVKPPVPRR